MLILIDIIFFLFPYYSLYFEVCFFVYGMMGTNLVEQWSLYVIQEWYFVLLALISSSFFLFLYFIKIKIWVWILLLRKYLKKIRFLFISSISVVLGVVRYNERLLVLLKFEHPLVKLATTHQSTSYTLKSSKTKKNFFFPTLKFLSTHILKILLNMF